MNFSSQNIIITGGANGIGKCIAEQFLARGARVAIVDKDENAVFTIDKRTGDAIPYGPYNEALFPDEAVQEAMEHLIGMPYTARGKLKITVFEEGDDEAGEAGSEDVAENEKEKIDMVGSEEYKALISRYTDEEGKINYAVMNKDFIQFASRSKVVSNMVSDKLRVDDILLYIVKSRAADLSGRKTALSNNETKALIETLDEINPRSAFKELKAHIKRALAKVR